MTRPPVRQAIAVPRDALVIRTDGISVCKISDEGEAIKVVVKTGVAARDTMEVVGEIEEGDQVVIRGNARLSPGSPVKLVQE